MAYTRIHTSVFGCRSLLSLFAFLLAIAAFALLPGRALATPGTPGVPQPGTQVYLEDFENTTSTTAVPLNTYTGSAAADNAGYTGSPNWAFGTDCNGLILDSTTPEPTSDNCFAVSGTAGTTFWHNSQNEAIALGEFEGESAATAASNHDLSEYTGPSATVGPGIELQTNPNGIPAVTGHYYDVRADYDAVDYVGGGAGCDFNDPSISLYLLNGTTTIQVGSALDPCTAAGNKDITVGGTNLRVAQLVSNGLQWTGGSTMGVEQYNAQGNGDGNDGATDNIQVVDVTPQLDKSLSPSRLTVGQSSALTFTFTNTSELGAKDGWSFTDSLPSGLKIANPAGASTTCSAGKVTAAAGGTSVAVSGNLDQGQASCTATVEVTSARPGTYTNGPANVTCSGCNPPGHSTVTFRRPVLRLTKTAHPRTINAGGKVSFDLKVSNPNSIAVHKVKVCDRLPLGLAYVSSNAKSKLSNGEQCWTLGTLGAHTSRTVTLIARALPGASGKRTNHAIATGKGVKTARAHSTVQIRPAPKHRTPVTG